MRRLLVLCLFGTIGCAGPAAPDAAVCQDLIHRLCAAPRCASVETQLAVSDDCEDALLARTGCGDPAFVFTSPSRERILSCREPLVREGNGVDDKPTCAEVDQTLSCADVEAFLNGEAP